MLPFYHDLRGGTRWILHRHVYVCPRVNWGDIYHSPSIGNLDGLSPIKPIPNAGRVQAPLSLIQNILLSIQSQLGISEMVLTDADQHILFQRYKRCYLQQWTEIVNYYCYEDGSLPNTYIFNGYDEADLGSELILDLSNPYLCRETVHVHIERLCKMLSQASSIESCVGRYLGRGPLKNSEKWLKDLLWDLCYQSTIYVCQFVKEEGFKKLIDLGDHMVVNHKRRGYTFHDTWIKIVRKILMCKEVRYQSFVTPLIGPCLLIVLRLALGHHEYSPLNHVRVSQPLTRPAGRYFYWRRKCQSSIQMPNVLLQNTRQHAHSVRFRTKCFEIVTLVIKWGVSGWNTAEKCLLHETSKITSPQESVLNSPSETMIIAQLWAIELASMVTEMGVGESTKFIISTKKMVDVLATQTPITQSIYSKDRDGLLIFFKPPARYSWKYFTAMLETLVTFENNAPKGDGNQAVRTLLTCGPSPTLGSSIRQIHLNCQDVALTRFTSKLYQYLPLLPTYYSPITQRSCAESRDNSNALGKSTPHGTQDDSGIHII
ncbi:hypothetical protein BASA62_007078 [Batrachochytrium salamandrivorans]|nr:hypothetical protein BASA62_007078 [Batrachochytrium salamandrivorans]